LPHLPVVNGVDRQNPATNPPLRLDVLIFVVVSQMPRHVAELIPMLDPVMRNAGDAPAGSSGSATGIIDLADHGVLGADCGSDGSRRVPDGRTTTVPMNRL
jgi:hypothetical protein